MIMLRTQSSEARRVPMPIRPPRHTVSHWRNWLLCIVVSACSGNGTAPENPIKPGQTDFTSNEPLGGGNRNRFGDQAAFGGTADLAAPEASDRSAPPSGRQGEVQEADIYRVDNNRLFYLNTYRGFVIYDVNNPRDPKRLSRLPVFGHPIEMFVEGNTVYALLKDALYLTQKQGRLHFERHNVSQLVTIDVSDLARPRVIKTIDIVGQLREGVSRKIDDTIYVVSYMPQSYYWGWAYGADQTTEQAWVYSFNVADRDNPALVDKLQVFEGGGYQRQQSTPAEGGGTHNTQNRWFQSVAISATANTLMVVENWSVSGYSSGSNGITRPACGSSYYGQQAVVSIVDISDPSGQIKLHTRFEAAGSLTDQFKQTYVHDQASNTGTYYGIFARNEWSSSDCSGTQHVQNTIEAWDVSDGSNPRRLSALAFGKPNETVRGSAFDLERKVAYAITAERIDPLYVISLDDRNNLRVLSEIDGLSGDMNVFRLVADRKFLIGIGRDNSETCSGFQGGEQRRGANIAVSLIDVRALDRIRLVERKCVAVENAHWIGSDLNWNLDQAHKMIGMHSDGRANVVTVPVYYYTQNDEAGWWWSRFETAVGMMSWDLSQYDDTKDETQQNVLKNHGTLVHPNGQVRRSIVFTHKGTSDRRMMINLSDTHISVADIDDLDQPELLSEVEVAPFSSQLYRFGNYIVEQVQNAPTSGFWPSRDGKSEFRVRPAGGSLEDTAPVATFSSAQVQQVIKHGDNLVIFRHAGTRNKALEYVEPSTEAVVYDLSNPRQPRLTGRATLPQGIWPYYRYFCGTGYFGGYWFDDQRNWAQTSDGIVFSSQRWDSESRRSIAYLTWLDLRDASAPKVSERQLEDSAALAYLGLVNDPVEPTSFWLVYRRQVGQIRVEGDVFYRHRYFAQRWQGAESVRPLESVNLPGRLIRTWKHSSGERMFLTHDFRYDRRRRDEAYYWQPTFRLNLLRQIAGGESVVNGDRSYTGPVAELLDQRRFDNLNLRDLAIDGDRLVVNAQRGGYYWGWPVAEAVRSDGIGQSTLAMSESEDNSDRLYIFDLAARRFDQQYGESTGTYNVELMGTYQGQLFVNLPGDGVLAVDLSDASRPVGKRFLRTLGYARNIEFAQDTAYVSSGYFGVYQMPLDGSTTIAVR